MKSKLTYYVFLLLAILIIMLVPRGSTVVNNNAAFAPNGKPSLEASADMQGALSSSDSELEKRIKQQNVYGQSFKKTDYGFIVYYRALYRLDLSAAPEIIPNKVTLSAKMPGNITKVKGGNFEANTAYWEIDKGSKGDYVAESKHIRWWLVIASFLIAMFFLFLTYVRITTDAIERKKTNS